MKRANSLKKQTKLYISAACGGNAHGVCRPGRDTAVRRKSFLPYFLYFTKSRKKKPPKAAIGCRRQHKKAAQPPKKRPRSGENCCGSNRKVPPKAAKGFNFVGAKPPLRRAESRFAKPRCSLQRERVVTFCVVQKVTKKHAGLRPATSIQSSAGNTFGETSDDTSRNRFFAQNGGEKALNRRDAPVLLREDLERRLKERPYSLQTVGYGWAGICGVGCGN